jgi:thiol-disulfide isomerase/thioredoxin/uncharacterized membrane protein YphA (DoxX/SURF4 family)
MVDVIALLLRFALAGVFAVAAISKLRDRAGTAEALEAFGAPARATGAGVYLLPAAELLGVILLLIPATSVAGAVWTLLLLAAFTLAISFQLARGNTPECRCFGEMSAKPIGARTIARNLALIAAAGFVIFAAPSTWAEAGNWIDSLGPEDRALSMAVAALLVAAAAQAWMVLRLRDANEALTKRVTSLETGPAAGLPMGTEAPEFSLPTVDGRELSLQDLLQAGKPVMLTFTDPHCGPCQSLMPQLVMWQKSLSNVFTVAIVSRGQMSDNEVHAAEHGLANVMVQKKDEVADAYAASATPSAVKISPDGKIDSIHAAGTDQIPTLFEDAIAQHAQSLWKQATGEEIPKPFTGLPLDSEAPEMIVHDLDRRQHSLTELFERPTMLVFWSPRCSFCHQVADDMRALEARMPGDKQIVYATTGTPEENHFLGFRSVMLNDPDFTLGNYFKATGTPGAVLLEEGKVASGLGSGTDGVLELAEKFVGPGPQLVEAPAFHPSDN